MYTRILLFCCLLPFALTAQKSMLVNPGKLFFQQSGSIAETKIVTITNQSNAPISIKTSFADWKRDSVGGKIYYAPGFLKNSCTNFIKTNPQYLTINPGESRNVEVTLLVPDSLSNQTSHSMLFITQFDENRAVEKSKELKQLININLEIGVHIYNEPPTLQNRAVDITNLQFIPVKDTVSSGAIIVNFKNTGELVASGDIRVELTDGSGKEYKLKADQFNTLPGDELRMQFRLPLLPMGKYQVVSILDPGNDLPLKIAEKEITVK